jgi:hypothetical protein
VKAHNNTMAVTISRAHGSLSLSLRKPHSAARVQNFNSPTRRWQAPCPHEKNISINRLCTAD